MTHFQFKCRQLLPSGWGFSSAWLLVLTLSIFPQILRAEDTLENVRSWKAEEVQQEILKAADVPGGADAKLFAKGPILLWVERCFLGTDNAYSGEGTRYAVLRLTVANRGQEEFTLKRENISLVAGAKTFLLGNREGLFRDIPLEIGWHQDGNIRPQSQLRTPKTIRIPPAGAKTFWCLFAGMDPIPAVPQMTIKLERDQGQPLELDLNAQQQTRLGLTSQRLGPADALTVFTLHGQLNRINSAFLAQQMAEASEAGSSRFIIEWSSQAKPSDEVLFGWLLSANPAISHENLLFLQLPKLPAVRGVYLSHLPKLNRTDLEREANNKWIFLHSRDAAVAALSDIDERLEPRDLLAQIRFGHPWSKQAVMRSAARRLGPEALPVLLEISHSPDPEQRQAAIFALGAQSAAAAEERLSQLLQSSDPREAESALVGLLAHSTPQHRALVTQQLSEHQLSIPRERVLKQLATYYHPDWNPELSQAVTDSDPKVRRLALSVLHQIGHPQLGAMCRRALNDADESVREQAFLVLIDGTDRASEQAAREYTMQQLRAGEINDVLLSFIERVQETQAAPLLLQQIRKSDQSWRGRLIDVVGQIGSNEDLMAVLQLMPTFNEDEQVIALGLVNRLSLETQLKFATAASRSEMNSVRYTALEILKSIGNSDAVKVLFEMLDNQKFPDDAEIVCLSLGEIGTEEAIKGLHHFRERAANSNREGRLRAVDQGLRVWKSRLPGYNYIQAGNVHAASQDEDEAIKAYSMAILINPDLADAYSARGNIYLRRNDFQQAGTDFKKAMKLDAYDGQAVTGVAIVTAIDGKWQVAVNLVTSKASRFPRDRFYAYNTACVYSRCIETLRKHEESAERDQQIEQFQNKAIEKLKESISLGFREYDWMQKDPDLLAIRELPKFKKLLKNE